MSRSRRKAVYKIGAGSWKSCLKRLIKRSQRNYFRSNISRIIDGDDSIPNAKTIVDDYTFVDIKVNYEDGKYSNTSNDEEFLKFKKKLSRK